MEVIILAGGFGTRLSHIVSDVPKPMAPVNSKPFLIYQFEYLLKNKVKHIVLAVGYKANVISDYFGNDYKGIRITYSTEYTPLGTGGAIKKALDFCSNEDVIILNGDTYFDVNLNEMKFFHEKHSSNVTIAVKTLSKYDRYGSVIVEDFLVKEFVEKIPTELGKINGGVYFLKKKMFDEINQDEFSFEKMVLESGKTNIYAYESNGYFIDIGVPKDYYKAQKELNFVLND